MVIRKSTILHDIVYESALQVCFIRARLAIRPHSRSLLESLRGLRVDAPRRASLYLPQYWAVILHDGRPAVTRKSGGPPLIFFEGKDNALKNDPRLKGKRPIKKPPRRLSGKEFDRLSKQYEGGRGGFRVVDKVAAAPGTFFFTKGMAGVAREVSEEVREQVRLFSRDLALQLSGRITVRL